MATPRPNKDIGGGGGAAAAPTPTNRTNTTPTPPPPVRKDPDPVPDVIVPEEKVEPEPKPANPDIEKDNLSQISNSNRRSKRSFKFEGSVGTSKSSSSSAKAQTKASGFFAGSFFKKILSICQSVWRYLQQIFTISLVRKPISFYRAEDFTTKGDRIYNLNEQDNEETLDMIEAACNYSASTSALFDKIIDERKESALSKKKMSVSLDFSRLTPWNDSMLDRLQSIFQIFDGSGDGLIDFDEMSNVMLEFGDKSAAEGRRKAFNGADSLGRGGLNFNEFVEMLYQVTVRSPDQFDSEVVDTFRLIDRNMARIRGLDVVQQLQTGLF